MVKLKWNSRGGLSTVVGPNWKGLVPVSPNIELKSGGWSSLSMKEFVIQGSSALSIAAVFLVTVSPAVLLAPAGREDFFDLTTVAVLVAGGGLVGLAFMTDVFLGNSLSFLPFVVCDLVTGLLQLCEIKYTCHNVCTYVLYAHMYI